jgi:hypothetical protein
MDDVGGHYVGRSLLLGNPEVQATLAELSDRERAQAEGVIDRAHGSVGIMMDMGETEEFIANMPDYRRRLREHFQDDDLTEEQLRFANRQLRGMRAQGARRHFDQTLRHEIGHAVDELLGASSTYCRTEAGGGWRALGGDEGVVQELFSATGLAGASEEVQAFIRYRLEYETGVSIGDIREPVSEPSLTAAQRAAMQRMIDMVNWGDGALAGQTPSMDIAGRVYTKHPVMGWHSYSRDARERQVSNYQFFAPAEWFAEAYAAYYDPSRQRGDRLVQAGDSATAQYFDRVVHPFVARSERTSEGEFTERQ